MAMPLSTANILHPIPLLELGTVWQLATVQSLIQVLTLLEPGQHVHGREKQCTPYTLGPHKVKSNLKPKL